MASADVVQYFGTARVPHAFHFPGDAAHVPAVAAREAAPSTISSTRHPRSRELRGRFLRHHDELTLGWSPDEDRDYMYEEYDKDPMKLNLGILRRSGPRFDNGRDESELILAVMFSRPSSRDLLLGGRWRWATTCSRRTATACARRSWTKRPQPACSRADVCAACTRRADGTPSTCPCSNVEAHCAPPTSCCSCGCFSCPRPFQGAPVVRFSGTYAPLEQRRTRKGVRPRPSIPRTTSCCACSKLFPLRQASVELDLSCY